MSPGGAGGLDHVRVLCVEDDSRLLEWVGGIVRRVGGSVDYAGSLTECLDRLSRGGIDLVLLDLGLPDSAGVDTLDAVLDGFPWVSVIVVSGADNTVAEAAIERGADEFIRKPIGLDGLEWGLRMALARWRRRQRRVGVAKVRAMLARLEEGVLYATSG